MNAFNKTVLVLQAHPDDMEAWCSGTLSLMKERGYKIVVASMTAGGLGGLDWDEEGTIEVRKGEAAASAAVLDADYHCLDQRDGFVFDSFELRVKVCDLIRKVGAGIIFTHLASDYHADHRATALITDAAAMVSALPNFPSREKPLEITPLLYHTAPMTLKDPVTGEAVKPGFFVDITSVMDKKMEMLSHHKSQIDLMKHMHKMDNFFEVAKESNLEIGKMAGYDYAECFWQHRGGGYQKDPVVQELLKSFVKENDL